MENIEVIKRILEDVLNIDAEGIESDTTLESIGMDSLDAVELVAEVEERFDRELIDADKITTIGDVLARIQ